MACYELLGTVDGTVVDVSWAYEAEPSVWVHARDAGVSTMVRLTLDDMTTLDSAGPGLASSADYILSGPIATDDRGDLWWAEEVTPTGSGSHGIIVWRHDPGAETTTQMLTISSISTQADHKLHNCTGLEWHAASDRFYLAWDYARAGFTHWQVVSFDPTGGDLTIEASGASALPDVVGPLVLTSDEDSLWLRHRTGFLYQLGHMDLSSGTVTADPTGGEGLLLQPGIPTPERLTFSPGGAWRAVTYTGSGFTVEDAACTDSAVFSHVAYHQWSGDAAFVSGNDLYRQIVQQRRFWLGKVGFRG